MYHLRSVLAPFGRVERTTDVEGPMRIPLVDAHAEPANTIETQADLETVSSCSS
jgi:hypothetical protein